MQRRHLTLGLAGTLIAGFAGPALAQDDGEYTILRARYGTDRNQVDVTDRLRQLARQDQRFRLTNDIFGVDPDPGRQKTLRITARDRQGRERQFDYRERDRVDGSRFIGWSGGNWGDGGGGRGWQGSHRSNGNGNDDGEFTILYATYGTGRREVDVTDRLRELARRDQRFRLTNDLFGTDPDPGQTKQLRIVTRDRNGQQRSFDYREYQTVDGHQFVGWGRGDWGRSSDRDRGRRDEHGPARPVMGGGGLSIESASYGADDRWADVTQAVRAQLRGDRLEVIVTNEMFGRDPAPGQYKSLSVTYRWGNGPTNTVRAGERDMLRLP